MSNFIEVGDNVINTDLLTRVEYNINSNDITFSFRQSPSELKITDDVISVEDLAKLLLPRGFTSVHNRDNVPIWINIELVNYITCDGVKTAIVCPNNTQYILCDDLSEYRDLAKDICLISDWRG